MFTLNHYIWLAICIISIVVFTILIKKLKPSFNLIFTIAVILCVLSEATKMFSVIKFDYIGEDLVPYIQNQHLPLHLCSIQIIFIVVVRFMNPNNKIRSGLLGFMFPTFIIGASLALLIPTIFESSVPVEKAFIHPLAYQYFLYHAMLITLGIYIITEKEFNIQPKHYLTTMMILGLFGLMSLYLNSIFAHMTYDVEKEVFDLLYSPNFFFTAISPIPGIRITEPWHWYLYILIIVIIAFSSIAIFYIPIFIRYFKNKKSKTQTN